MWPAEKYPGDNIAGYMVLLTQGGGGAPKRKRDDNSGEAKSGAKPVRWDRTPVEKNNEAFNEYYEVGSLPAVCIVHFNKLQCSPMKFRRHST